MRTFATIGSLIILAALVAALAWWADRRERERFKAYDDCVKAHVEICQ